MQEHCPSFLSVVIESKTTRSDPLMVSPNPCPASRKGQGQALQQAPSIPAFIALLFMEVGTAREMRNM